MLTLRRARRPLAVACIVLVAVAVSLPGVAAVDLAPPSPEYVLLPQLEPLALAAEVLAPAEQTEQLRTILPERAPPLS